MQLRMLLFVLLFATSCALAGTGTGQVELIYAHSMGGNGEGIIIFDTENNTNKAACSTSNNGTQWAISLEKQSGRAMLAVLLSANAQGKDVYVAGANDCADWGDRERPIYVRLKP